MTPRQETGMALITATVLIILIMLLSLCSCSTKEHVVETVYVHDTVFSHHTDTIKDVKVLHIKDTVHQNHTHTYVIKENGDTAKEIHFYHEITRVEVNDSTYYYQSERDSLKQALKEEKQKDKVVVKTKKVMAWWGWIIVGGSIGITILYFFRNMLTQRKKT